MAKHKMAQVKRMENFNEKAKIRSNKTENYDRWVLNIKVLQKGSEL